MWFGGYTKQFTTVVWVGSPGNPYSMGSVFGGSVAAPIWVAYMSRVMQGLPAMGSRPAEASRKDRSRA